MNKEEIVQELAAKVRVTQVDAKKIINALIDTIEKTVSKGEKVTLQGFGVFKLQHRASRTARIINENKVIRLPETTIPVFIPSKTFKCYVENYKKDSIYCFSKKYSFWYYNK